ncbi:MAG: hypothetical protein ACRDV1_00365 [Actinomycetes bacterium]
MGDAVATAIAARGVTVAQPQLPMAATVGTGRRISRKATAAAAAALRQPGLSMRLARCIRRSGQGGPGEAAARLVQWHVAQHLLGRPGSRRSVHILDEGLLQCLWSIGLRGDVEPVIGTLDASAGWREPDLLVVVRTSPVIAEQRLASRTSQHSRTQNLSGEARLPELVLGEELLDRLVRWWASDMSRHERVLEVSGAEATADERSELVRRIVTAVDRAPWA